MDMDTDFTYKSEVPDMITHDKLPYFEVSRYHSREHGGCFFFFFGRRKHSC